MSKLISLFMFCLLSFVSGYQISDKRLCADEKCATPISEATTLLGYHAGGLQMLSFKPKTKLTIYSKSAGSNPSLWGAALKDGKRGYVPKDLVRENKVFFSEPSYEVDTELKDPAQDIETVQPDKVIKTFDLIDGTKIYRDETTEEIEESLINDLEDDEVSVELMDDGEEDLNVPLTSTVPQNFIENSVSSPADQLLPDPKSEILSSQELPPSLEVQKRKELPETLKDLNSTESTQLEIIKIPEASVDNFFETSEKYEKVSNLKDTDSNKVSSGSILPEFGPNNDLNQLKPLENVIRDSIAPGLEVDEPLPVLNSSYNDSVIPVKKLDSNEIRTVESQDQSNQETYINISNNFSESNLDANIPQSNLDFEASKVPQTVIDDLSYGVETTSEFPKSIEFGETSSNSDSKTTTPVISSNYEASETPTDIPIVKDQYSQNSVNSFLELSTEIPTSFINSSPESLFVETTTEVPESNKASIVNEIFENSIVEASTEIPKFESKISSPILNAVPSADLTRTSAAEILDITTTIDIPTNLDVIQNTPNSEMMEDIQTTPNPEIIEEEQGPVNLEDSDEFGRRSPSPTVENIVVESDGFLESISSWFDFESTKTEEIVPINEITKSEISRELVPPEPSIWDSPRDQQSSIQTSEKKTITGDIIDLLFITDSTYGIIIYLSITSLTVLIFTLGYYYIEKLRQDGTLIKRINDLEKALLNTDKDRTNLQLELEHIREKEVPTQLLKELENEITELHAQKLELEEQNTNLERELEAATEAGLELNKMIGELLNSQQGGDAVEESLEFLRKQLTEKQATVAELMLKGKEKDKEYEAALNELAESKTKIGELTNEVDSLVHNLTKLQEASLLKEVELSDRFRVLQSQHDSNVKTHAKIESELKLELDQIKQFSKQLQHALNVKEKEINLIKEGLKENSGNVVDVSNLKAELSEVTTEKENLEKQLKIEVAAKNHLREDMVKIDAEKQELFEKLQNVDKDKIEVQTRLDVLSSYFKEKESQLQKELAKHEELWLQNQGETSSTVERIKLLQEEIQNYKTQNEMLKNEIVDQEISLKSQISVLEKKGHENWLLLRQAERRLEDSKQECGQLRNRLTLVEKNLTDDKGQYRVLSPMNANGEISTSPINIGEPPISPPIFHPHNNTLPNSPFMGLPPPPPGGLPFLPPPPSGVAFMPPPPSIYPGDHRPPPLGRMSSPPPPPPPPSTFSPTRPYYDQGRDSPPMLSPNNRMMYIRDNDYNYRHRSPPPPANYSIRSSELSSSRSKKSSNENV